MIGKIETKTIKDLERETKLNTMMNTSNLIVLRDMYDDDVHNIISILPLSDFNCVRPRTSSITFDEKPHAISAEDSCLSSNHSTERRKWTEMRSSVGCANCKHSKLEPLPAYIIEYVLRNKDSI